MAQTVEELAEIITNMREENQRNNDNFEKVLTNINAKLELMADDNEATDLLKLYISELRKSVDEKHNVSMERFKLLDKAFEQIVSDNIQLVKATDLKELYDAFNSSLGAFSVEMISQKESLDNVFAKIENVKSAILDKDELASLLNDLSSSVATMSMAYNATLASITEQIQSIDSKEDLATLNNRITSVIESIEAVPAKISFETLQEKLDSFKDVTDSVKNIVLENSEKLSVEFVKKFEKLEKDFENIVTDSDFAGFRTNLADFVQKIIDNSTALNAELSYSTERIENILTTVRSIDFRDDFENVISRINDLKETFEEGSRVNYNSLHSELTNLSNNFDESFKNLDSKRQEVYVDLKNELTTILDNLKNIFEASKGEEQFESLTTQLAGLKNFVSEDISSAVVSVNENADSNYSAIKDYIEEIVSNLNVLGEEFKNVAKKDLDATVSKIETVSLEISNFKDEFRQVVSADLENSSRIVDELVKILSKFEDLKTEISALGDDSDLGSKIVESSQMISALSANIETLKDFTTHNSTKLLDEISENLTKLSEKLGDELNSSVELNFGSIRTSFDEILPLIEKLGVDFGQKNDSILFHFSAGFESLKSTIENVNSSLVASQENNSTGLDKLILLVSDVTAKTDELKSEINSAFADYTAKIVESVNELALKLEHISEKDNSDEKLVEIKNIVSSLNNELRLDISESLNAINENNSSQLSAINNVCKEVSEFKTQMAETLESLKAYTGELNSVYSEAQISLENKISTKFLDLESTFVTNSHEFEEKVENLQAKLTEFAHIVENSNADTEGKIALSLEEISEIKEEVSAISNYLQVSKVATDDKYNETATLVEAGLENILFNLNNISETLAKGFESREEFVVIENNFSSLMTSIDALHAVCENTVTSFDKTIDDKFATIKEEISLVNSDINEAFASKTQEITKAFENVKTVLDSFAGFEFEKGLDELKANLKESFATFSVDINGELSAESTAIARLEEAYKESYNRIVAIEECVTERLNDNLELLNATIEVGLKDIKAQIGEPIDFTEIKADIDALNLNGTQVLEAINDFKEDFTSGVSNLDGNVKNYVVSASKSILDKSLEMKESVSTMLEALHAKVDVLAMEGNEFDIADEIDDIKELIFEQRKYFESTSDEKTEAIDKYLKDVLLKLDNVDLDKSAEDIKESIMNVLLSLVDQISFVEETEEIKDFVEERTDLINQNLLDVKNQLRQLTSMGDDFDYSYTLQDVESDIARLRLAISNMSGNDFEDFADDIKRIVHSVEGLENSLTQEQIVDLKNDIFKLNEDIISISSRTNKLLLTSDESYKALSDGLNNFSNIIYKLEDRLDYLDNTEITTRLEKKIDDIHTLSTNSANNDKMFHQVMTYLGEWIDVAGENINGIVEKTTQIDDIRENIAELKSILPDKEEILDEIEHRFEQQEERIDRLEMKLEKVLSTLEQKDDTLLNKKVDKIEKLLSTLAKDIEKLTSYVDEE